MEPAGNVRLPRSMLTSVNSVKGKFSGSGNCFLSGGSGVCSVKVCKVTVLFSAGRLSDSMIRITALILPSSIFEVTMEAKS